MDFIPAPCKITLGILDTVEVLHLWLLKEKDVLVPNSSSFIHSTIFINQCFIWLVEKLFFDTKIPQLASSTDKPVPGKKSDLGHKKHCQAAPGLLLQQFSCLCRVQSLSLLNSAKPEPAVHSTRLQLAWYSCCLELDKASWGPALN